MLHLFAQMFFGMNLSHASSSAYETWFLDMLIIGSSSEHIGDEDGGAVRGSEAKMEAIDRFFVDRNEASGTDGRTAGELGRPRSFLPFEPN